MAEDMDSGEISISDIHEFQIENGFRPYTPPLLEQIRTSGKANEINAKLLAARAAHIPTQVLAAWLGKAYAITTSRLTVDRYIQNLKKQLSNG